MLRALALLLLALPSFACCPVPQANSSCDHKMSEAVPDPTSPPSLQKVQKQKWVISSDVFKRARKLFQKPYSRLSFHTSLASIITCLYLKQLQQSDWLRVLDLLKLSLPVDEVEVITKPFGYTEKDR